MTQQLKIYISGLYSGTNPQPGIGIARSLRQAYPDSVLIGVEYSNRCSGIHWMDFDDIWLQRPWDELNLDAHARSIKEVLDSGALWISSIDLEIMWLADVFPDGHPNLLTPPMPSLRRVAKPDITASAELPFKIPTFVTTELSDWELHSFCREHDWKVWLKGPYYEAVRTPTWSELQRMRGILSSAWATEKLFLQSHVSGYEESVMLSAYRGELLDCVRMRKRDITDLSKTWAGDTSRVPDDVVYPLRKVIRELNWTGGAELEMVRDADDQLWLLEWNPRYPAWVHGATILGHNLPAALVEGATGFVAQGSPAMAQEFTRVVLEVPVRPEFPLPPLPEPLGGVIGHSLKHPSGLVEFAGRLRDIQVSQAAAVNGHAKTAAKPAWTVPSTFMNDLESIDFGKVETPSRLFLQTTALDSFARASKLATELSSPEIRVSNAYSMKTNPDERLIKLALGAGFYAEAISLLEVKKALETGFRADQIILNGPAKWWRRDTMPKAEFFGIFCDSIEEIERVTDEMNRGELTASFVGVRLRTPNIPSRFGVPVDTPDVFEKLIRAIRQLPRECGFGIHFHMASSNVGVGQWWHLFEAMLRWCSSIEALSGRIVETLDVGGGWFPDDLEKDGGDRFRDAVDLIPEYLSSVRQVISEPGKALAQPSMALASQILEVRSYTKDAQEVVVDASIAELPMYFVHPHRILHFNNEVGWSSLRRGKSLLYGRLCMEHDIVASNVDLPESAAAGDLLVFCDAGAYDRSMSYVFGCG